MATPRREQRREQSSPFDVEVVVVPRNTSSENLRNRLPVHSTNAPLSRPSLRTARDPEPLPNMGIQTLSRPGSSAPSSGNRSSRHSSASSSPRNGARSSGGRSSSPRSCSRDQLTPRNHQLTHPLANIDLTPRTSADGSDNSDISPSDSARSLRYGSLTPRRQTQQHTPGPAAGGATGPADAPRSQTMDRTNLVNILREQSRQMREHPISSTHPGRRPRPQPQALSQHPPAPSTTLMPHRDVLRTQIGQTERLQRGQAQQLQHVAVQLERAQSVDSLSGTGIGTGSGSGPELGYFPVMCQGCREFINGVAEGRITAECEQLTFRQKMCVYCSGCFCAGGCMIGIVVGLITRSLPGT